MVGGTFWLGVHSMTVGSRGFWPRAFCLIRRLFSLNPYEPHAKRKHILPEKGNTGIVRVHFLGGS